MYTQFKANNNGYTTTYAAYREGKLIGYVTESELLELYEDSIIEYRDKKYTVSEFFSNE